MNDEKLDFMQMLSCIRVIDENDRTRKFKDAIEEQYDIVARKVAEYHKNGELIIKMKFKYDKDSKNGVNVFAEAARKIPKGSCCNMFYLDEKTGGLYFDNPNQMKIFTADNVHYISDKDAAGQNEN